MDDTHNTDSSQDSTNSQPENDTQRLHRLVIPMILNILRSRGEQRQPSRGSSRHSQADDTLWNSAGGSQDEPPSLDIDPSIRTTPHEGIAVDEADNTNRNGYSEGTFSGLALPTTDQQGQLIPSAAPIGSPPSPRRPRYRLVVYFEERDLSSGTEVRENEEEGDPSPHDEVQNHRPSRYVAVFSIDSDAQDMPIIHSAGVQQSHTNFDDLLNTLFTSYLPKGTPPAKKEIIDSLPTTAYCHETCSTQPRCTVCLEEFSEGAEVVVLPCSHQFHGDECVKPWLRMHNSCPLCRYEMPVDDMEYEEKRRERMAIRATPSESNTRDLC